MKSLWRKLWGLDKASNKDYIRFLFWYVYKPFGVTLLIAAAAAVVLLMTTPLACYIRELWDVLKGWLHNGG